MMDGMANGKGLATIDASLTREETMLMHKVELLEKFLETNQDARPSIYERCRVLQQRVSVIEAAVFNAGKRDSARKFIEGYSLSGHQDHRADFLEWLKSRDGYRAGPPLPCQPNASKSPLQGSRRTAETSSDMGIQKGEMSSEQGFTSHRLKRIRTTASEKPACLRCRILKKKCNSSELCGHCPLQNDENQSDYWKVLGCYRGPLRTLSNIFCPAFSRTTVRNVRKSTGLLETIYLTAACPSLPQDAEARIAYLIENNPDFSNLKDSIWTTTALLTSLSETVKRSIPTNSRQITPLTFQNNMEDFEALWYVLYAISVEPRYVSRTEYNLFTLIRLSNKFSHGEQTIRNLVNRAKNLLRKSVEILLSERGILASTTFEPWGLTPWPSIDLKSDIEEFLDIFESACCSRGKLFGVTQIACFYALLLLSVVKSVLIDAYSIKRKYEDPNPWQESDAGRIASAYKALVSVFTWACKSDPLLDSETETSSPQLRFAIQETREMLHHDKWAETGIKGSRDFLLGLGSCLLPNGAYNGFLVQKSGLPRLGNSPLKTSNAKTTRLIQEENFEINTLVTGSLTPNFETRVFGTTESGSINDDPTSAPASINRAHSSINVSNKTAVWEHMVVSDGGLSVLSEPRGNGMTANSGRRKGKLAPEAAAKAARLRQVKACWKCWISKVPPICERCLKFGRNTETRCNRSSFIDYSYVFLPEIMYYYFGKSFIDSYLNTNSKGFTGNSFEIEVGWDGLCSVSLLVNEFAPKTGETLRPITEWVGGRLKIIYSVPVGIASLSVPDIIKLYKDALNARLVDQAFPGKIAPTHDTRLCGMTLDIVVRYYRYTKAPLLRKAIWLYTLYHFMERIVVLTNASSLEILTQLKTHQGSMSGYTYKWSQVLDLQIKSLLGEIARDLIKEILEGLEKNLRSRSKGSWPTSFCTILLLCMCTEEIQIAAITSVRIRHIAGIELLNESAAIEICEELEDGAVKVFADIFHDIYKTYRVSADGTKEGGYNPLRQVMADRDSNLDIDDCGTHMVREIGAMVSDFYPELQERSKLPSFEAPPAEFARKNRRHLVSKFLLSFFDEHTLKKLAITSNKEQNNTE